jgi:hypothetical protein
VAGLVAMSVFLTAAYIGLFALAVFSKLDEWPRWRRAMRGFVHGRAGSLLQHGIPAAEAAVVVALIVRPRVGLIAGGALLTILAVGVLVLRKRHAGASCSCFGTALEGTIGVGLALRNGALAVVAGIAAGASPRRLTPLEVLLSATAVALVLFGAEAYRFHKRSVEVGRAVQQ